MENNKDLKQTINVNVGGRQEGQSEGKLKVAEFIKGIITDLENTSFRKMVRFVRNIVMICVSFVLIIFCYNITKNQNVTNQIINKMLSKEEDEAIGMEIRDLVTPKINNNLDKYMYELKADRAVIFEIHNGKENATHLPFTFADMSFERTNDQNKEVAFVSNQFQNIRLTDYKIPYYISDNTYFIGTVDEAKQIDSRFGYLMEKTKGHYICATVLRSNGKDIGFLVFFYDNNNMPNESKNEIEETLKNASVFFSSLLDLQIQKKKYLAQHETYSD